jgi:hypothetical protein
MPRRSRLPPPSIADDVLETHESTVLDLVEHLLNKGVMANGDVTLGVAGIDLIYLRLAALLCAADRVLPHGDIVERSTRRRRKPTRLKRRT